VKTRQTLKQELLQQVAALGQEALLPVQKHELDGMVQELECLNPTPSPLALANRSLLLGYWKLIYASSGTVVTRRLAPGIIINEIWQSLSPSEEAAIVAVNGMELELPVLGKLQLQVNGVWRWQGETQTARVSFDAFSVQAVELLHQSDWQIPTLQVPIFEGLRREADWRTSYLDSDLRIGCGATGNRFVFMRLL
jgi:hypothetical protein